MGLRIGETGQGDGEGDKLFDWSSRDGSGLYNYHWVAV